MGAILAIKILHHYDQLQLGLLYVPVQLRSPSSYFGNMLSHRQFSGLKLTGSHEVAKLSNAHTLPGKAVVIHSPTCSNTEKYKYRVAGYPRYYILSCQLINTTFCGIIDNQATPTSALALALRTRFWYPWYKNSAISNTSKFVPVGHSQLAMYVLKAHV